MWILLAVCEGVGFCVTTFWELQELRFSAAFDYMSSVALGFVMATASCILNLRS
uniref:Uncharacterized protein n=1 Tax=Kalanchoe fedtschenkoi TaxID=63787 RepID=A0A7N0UEA8_KALFE